MQQGINAYYLGGDKQPELKDILFLECNGELLLLASREYDEEHIAEIKNEIYEHLLLCGGIVLKYIQLSQEIALDLLNKFFTGAIRYKHQDIYPLLRQPNHQVVEILVQLSRTAKKTIEIEVKDILLQITSDAILIKCSEEKARSLIKTASSLELTSNGVKTQMPYAKVMQLMNSLRYRQVESWY